MLPKDPVRTSGKGGAYWKDDGRQDGLFLSSFWTPKWVSNFPVPVLIIASLYPTRWAHPLTDWNPKIFAQTNAVSLHANYLGILLVTEIWETCILITIS